MVGSIDDASERRVMRTSRVSDSLSAPVERRGKVNVLAQSFSAVHVLVLIRQASISKSVSMFLATSDCSSPGDHMFIRGLCKAQGILLFLHVPQQAA